MSKAEYYYTQGINCFPLSESSGSYAKSLLLCYINRAATRISLKWIREALGDCIAAAALDPSFLKAYLRAANCHLSLGEVENAIQYYNKCLESGSVVCLDRKIMVEAAEGLHKAQKVAECINSSAELLVQNSSNAATSALGMISEALSYSSRSEKLIKMKAEALYMLQLHKEVIQLCEQTLEFAERNYYCSGTDNQSAKIEGSGWENFSYANVWRWHLMSRSYFHMGKFEKALDLLEKLEQEKLVQEKSGQEILISSKSLASTINELLRLKNAGNEAVQSGRYTEAIEHYSVAVSNNVLSRPFAAICFCNRAAAHQALGQITDAIADCSLAMALDKSYKKAFARRAALHEMIRDYEQASNDLQRFIYILKNEYDEKSKTPGTPGKCPIANELKQAQRHFSIIQEEAKKGDPLDLYIILGIKQSDTSAKVKKAYRKAALRHHPDKAGQFLARSECGDAGGIWKEISDEVYKDADRLFKMIGEAYAVLSDNTKRSEYDIVEESRKALKERNRRRNTYKRLSEDYNFTFGRRNWQESWKANGNGYSRW
ncbi:hypothetical protein ACFE04_011794 [Oxalis oulophora]